MSATSPRNIKRRANFQVLVTSGGGVNEVARLIKSPPSHISAILAGNAGIGDKLAGKIERSFEMAPGALDNELSSQTNIPEIDQIARALARMVLSKQMSREEVVSMLGILLAREKLSKP